MESFKFNPKELENKLNTLNEWVNGFDTKSFVNKVSQLKFTSPKKEDVFKSFELFEPQNTKILILGLDPYPDENKAHGLAFSFGNGNQAEDSLLNIFKAIKSYKEEKLFYNIKDEDVKSWETNLEEWAKQNKVLLLNTALTYENKNQKTKHQTAWNAFIKNIIKNLLTCNKKKLVVFLWGGDAQKLFHNTVYNADNSINRDLLVLATSHPTKNRQAYKKGFCYEAPNHFKVCDKFLEKDIWKTSLIQFNITDFKKNTR